MNLPVMFKSTGLKTPLFILIFFVLAFSRCNKDSGNNSDSGTTPLLSITPITLNEGTGGNTKFGFELTLNAAYSQAVSVEISTASGSAISAEDFVAVDKQVVTIPAGQTKATFNVDVVGDEWKEATEDFLLQLTNPVNCRLASLNYKGFILNDDSRIRINDDGSNTSPDYISRL